MIVDPRERFGPIAETYDRYRPAYPAALLDWIADTTGVRPPAEVVDLGCGTGITTRQLAARGYAVVGIDPNEEMLAIARRRGPERYVRGDSTATGLSFGSADLAVSGQAFHWFGVPATLEELRRVLRADGGCAAFWNLRAESRFLADYRELLREHAPEYGTIRTVEDTIGELRASAGVTDVREVELPNAQRLDREGFLGRVRSSSYVFHGLERREAFEKRLGELFDRYQEKGRIVFAYRTVAIAWRLA